jgi:hypothetical protein
MHFLGDLTRRGAMTAIDVPDHRVVCAPVLHSAPLRADISKGCE